MDFRICPTCKQSVLDDEAEDCPFCGASMSGKPSAAAPAKPAAAKTTVKKEADTKAATAKKTAPKKDEPQDDPNADPFDIKSEVKQKKLFLMRVKAVPGCRFPVKCPMCGVEGYIPEKQGGKEIKCRDSTCLVPVFTAPMPEKKEVVEEKPKGLSANAIVGISLAVLLIGGAAVGYYVMNPGDDFELRQADDDPKNVDPNSDPTKGLKPNTPIDCITGDCPEEKQEITLDELKANFFDGDLPLIVRVAQDRKNTRKIESRQIAAVAYAFMANEKKMREQLDGLDRVARSGGVASDYMKARPLTALGWAYLNNQKSDEAKGICDEALVAAESLPKSGDSSTISTAVQLAALAASLGKLDEARELITRFESPDRQRLYAARLVTATKNKTFDFALETKLLGESSPKYPISTAVVRVLAAKGNNTAAVQWVKSTESAEEKSECLGGIAAEIAIKTANQSDLEWQTEIASAVDGENEQTKSFTYSRLALAFAVTKQAEHAKSAHQLAVAELEKTEEFPSAGNIDLLAIHRGSFRVPFSTALAAESYAALAAASYVSNDAETGWKMTFEAVGLAQQAMPPIRVLDSMAKELSNNKLAVDRQLRNTLNLSNDNQVRREFSRYRQNLTALKNRVDEIQNLQADSLLIAADNGQAEAVVGIVKNRDSATGADWAPLLDSEFSGSLREILRENGNDELLSALQKSMGRRSFKGPADAWIAKRRVSRLVNDGQIANASSELRKYRVSPDELQEIILQIGSEQAAKGEYENAAKWSVIQNDTLAKEQLMRLLAGHSVQNQQAGRLWNELRTSDLSLTEKGMVCLGVAQSIDW